MKDPSGREVLLLAQLRVTGEPGTQDELGRVIFVVELIFMFLCFVLCAFRVVFVLLVLESFESFLIARLLGLGFSLGCFLGWLGGGVIPVRV